MTGSGKSVVSDMFVKKGYKFFRFGQITLDLVKEKGLEPTDENEKPIREKLRKEHGMGAYALLNIPKIDGWIKDNNIVGDGLYSWSEYKILKEKYGKDFVVIGIYAPPNLRYKRLNEREVVEEDIDLRNRPANPENAKKRDYAEIENIEKGGPIAMADYTILNIGTTKDLEDTFNKIINEIEG